MTTYARYKALLWYWASESVEVLMVACLGICAVALFPLTILILFFAAFENTINNNYFKAWPRGWPDRKLMELAFRCNSCGLLAPASRRVSGKTEGGILKHLCEPCARQIGLL